MSDCSMSAMCKHEIHCRNKQECIDNGVIVPEECFRYCHGGDSDRVRFAVLAELAREMLDEYRLLYAKHATIAGKVGTFARFEAPGVFAGQLEALGVSVDG